GHTHGIEACTTPRIPPMTNIERKPIVNSIGVFRRIFPPHIVASQLNTFTPDGTAIVTVAIMKGMRTVMSIPVVNMWWTHTVNPRSPIATVEYAIALYPKIGFRLITGITSEIIPIEGRIMMYTAGWL